MRAATWTPTPPRRLTSSPRRRREAFDLSREPARVLDRYGRKDDKYIYVGKKADSPWEGHKFLLARRLVEAGVPVVTLRAGGWDHHGNVVSSFGGTIFISLRSALPLLDRSIYALVTDLHERGLDKEVLVLVWGEFGRTPKISQNGRDHWPDASFALFAGAVRGGQVVGQTDSRGERPRTRAVGTERAGHGLPRPRHRPPAATAGLQRPTAAAARRWRADCRTGGLTGVTPIGPAFQDGARSTS